METLGNILVAKSGKKVANNFYCEKCDYTCCKLYNWKKHLVTAKHTQETNGNILETESGKKWQNEQIKEFACENCDKEFKTRSGLWKHNKNCNNEDKKNNEDIKNNENDDKELIMMLVKQNSEMLEVIKNGTHNTNNSHNNTNTNSHNKTFNLQFFLNETCKDAMNIMDFVDSIKLQLSDLENVGKAGYVEGISNIITTNLKALDVTQRPIHCADKKREVLYIKDDDKWEKDDEKTKIRKAIKRVACKNQRLLPKFKEEHPDCGKYHSKFSDQYNKIVVESMGGSGDNDMEKEDKIIKNISKNVTIDKE